MPETPWKTPTAARTRRSRNQALVHNTTLEVRLLIEITSCETPPLTMEMPTLLKLPLTNFENELIDCLYELDDREDPDQEFNWEELTQEQITKAVEYFLDDPIGTVVDKLFNAYSSEYDPEEPFPRMTITDLQYRLVFPDQPEGV